MTNKEYRDHIGISKSNLSKIGISPLHFKYHMDNPQSDTPALIFGRAVHKYILEKEEFFDEVAVAPNVDRRTKQGKADWQEFIEISAGKDVISQGDFETIKAMSDVVDQHEYARALLTGQHEQSFFWTDEMTGEPCKCRPDCLTEYGGEKLVVDYKTTASCQNGSFERDAKKYGYDLQAGMYTEGMFANTFEPHGFVFVAQEKSAPYAVRIYRCTQGYIEQGYDKFRELIGIYHDCKINDNWYGYEGPNNMETELLEDVYHD